MKIKKIFRTLPIMAMVVFSLLSCKKDNSEQNESPRGSVLYEKVSGQLYSYLSTHEETTIEDLQKQLEPYSQWVTSEVRNNILYVNIDGYEYMCDPYRETFPVGNGSAEINDTYLDNLINEINKTLYPDDFLDKARTAEETVVTRSANTRGATDDVVFLERKKFYVWDPWEQLIISPSDITQTIHRGTTLSALGLFSTCDIGLIICHGTEDGRIGVPAKPIFDNELATNGFVEGIDFTKGTVGAGGTAVQSLILKKETLEKFLTGDLSNTILWTAMCYANASGSVLKAVAKSRNVAAFAGGNKKVYLDGPIQNWTYRFTNLFYLGASAEDCAMTVFGKTGGEANSPITINYNTPENGTYSFEYSKHLAYRPLVASMKAVDNQPRASITLPYKMARTASSARAFTRATSNSTSAGFWIKNKETGKVTEQRIEASSVKPYLCNDYNKLISRLELLGVTDDLDEGTYEYRTYLIIDGKKDYSEGIYEFTVKRINQVVPEWILEKMEPHIPIYDGYNPPSVEGTYFVSPHTLSYNSNPYSTYKPGHIFADAYMTFSGQDVSQNKIDFHEIEVNNSGNIISERWGLGAFISGEGTNFSIFFNTAGEDYYSDGVVTSETAMIVSGTKTEAGIENICYAFVMIAKNDPHNHLMDVGDFRVFKDGNGLASATTLNLARQMKVDKPSHIATHSLEK